MVVGTKLVSRKTDRQGLQRDPDYICLLKLQPQLFFRVFVDEY